jgi:hypothetical protein
LPSSPAPLIGAKRNRGKTKTEIRVHQFDLKSSALLALSLCLMMVAVVTAPVCVFAAGAQPYPPSPGFITTLAAGEKAPVPKLERSSLLEVEATNIQVAKRVMNEPHLFAFEVVFNSGFLQVGPDNSGFTMSADYESTSDQV